VALSQCIAGAGDNAALEGCVGVVSSSCIAEEGGDTTMGMVQCYAREHAAWDGQLNAVYRRLRQGDDGGESALQRAQRAWITFRDANCEAMTLPYSGGSLRSVLHASCMADMTAHRTIELIRFEQDSDL